MAWRTTNDAAIKEHRFSAVRVVFIITLQHWHPSTDPGHARFCFMSSKPLSAFSSLECGGKNPNPRATCNCLML